MLKLTIYTHYPGVVAELIETHYKRMVTPEAAEMVGPIEVDEDRLEFPYSYTGKRSDDPLDAWIRWNMNGGLIRTSKLEKYETEEAAELALLDIKRKTGMPLTNLERMKTAAFLREGREER